MSDSPPPWEIPFSPRQEVLDLLPEAQGNDINGLGEADVRRPTPIMWHDSEIIAHGELQEYFRRSLMSEGAKVHRRDNLEFSKKPLPPLSSDRPDWTAAEWTRRARDAALAGEADQVGITRIRPEWVFEGFEADFEWIVVLAVAMDYECLKTAPSETSQVEVQKQYARGTRAAYRLASWMRGHGWDAFPHGGPAAGPVLMIPAAIEAGLGELGKHGSMINREFGSSFRLACVLTDMPLEPDAFAPFGADDFCLNCKVCTRVCPVDAIRPEKRTVRGEDKWYVDFDACFPYFVEHTGCGLCIGQCPWSRTGIAPRLADKMTKRLGN